MLRLDGRFILLSSLRKTTDFWLVAGLVVVEWAGGVWVRGGARGRGRRTRCEFAEWGHSRGLCQLRQSSVKIPNIGIWKFTDSPTLICRLIRSHPQSHLHPPHLPFPSVSLIPPLRSFHFLRTFHLFPSAFCCHLVTLPLLFPLFNFPWQARERHVSLSVCRFVFLYSVVFATKKRNTIIVLLQLSTTLKYRPPLKRLTGHLQL